MSWKSHRKRKWSGNFDSVAEPKGADVMLADQQTGATAVRRVVSDLVHLMETGRRLSVSSALMGTVERGDVADPVDLAAEAEGFFARRDTFQIIQRSSASLGSELAVGLSSV